MKNKNVLVIGDMIIDVYHIGEVHRLNPEGPMPLVNVDRPIIKAGGAGNVVTNLTSLFGKDWKNIHFIGIKSPYLNIIELDANKYHINENIALPTKHRVYADGQQLIRFDEEYRENYEFYGPIPDKVKRLFKECIENENINYIIVSDYGKGLITEEIMDMIRDSKIPFIVDPHPPHRDWYKGAYCITPNKKEYDEMNLLKYMASRQGYCDNVLLTDGANGMVLFNLTLEQENATRIPARYISVRDVTGAGDTVIATLVWALCEDYPILEAAKIANIAASIAVGKPMTYSVSQQELLNVMYSDSEK